MDTAWTWDLSGYCAKYCFLTESKGLTMREVERIFQLASFFASQWQNSVLPVPGGP